MALLALYFCAKNVPLFWPDKIMALFFNTQARDGEGGRTWLNGIGWFWSGSVRLS
jgi:hypothetical protein